MMASIMNGERMRPSDMKTYFYVGKERDRVIKRVNSVKGQKSFSRYVYEALMEKLEKDENGGTSPPSSLFPAIDEYSDKGIGPRGYAIDEAVKNKVVNPKQATKAYLSAKEFVIMFERTCGLANSQCIVQTVNDIKKGHKTKSPSIQARFVEALERKWWVPPVKKAVETVTNTVKKVFAPSNLYEDYEEVVVPERPRSWDRPPEIKLSNKYDDYEEVIDEKDNSETLYCY